MTTYKYIDDEIVLKRNIDNLEQLAKDELLKKGEKIELEIQDMYLLAALDKTIKMLDSYLYAYDRKNITVLAALSRMEIEIAARVYGITLVENQTMFCEDIIINKKRVDKQVDIYGERMYDSYLCKKLGEWLGINLVDIYKKVCEYVHFTPTSLFSTVAGTENNIVHFFF